MGVTFEAGQTSFPLVALPSELGLSNQLTHHSGCWRTDLLVLKALGINLSSQIFFQYGENILRYLTGVWKRLNSHVSLYSVVVKLLPAHLNSWKESRVEQQLYWGQWLQEVWRWGNLHSLAKWQLRGGYDSIDICSTYQEKSLPASLKVGKQKNTERNWYIHGNFQ